MTRVGLLLALSLLGCVSKAKEAINGPEPEGGGTLTCKEVVEQCDSQCSDPFCVNRCTPQGNDDAKVQHQALIDCGQSNGCTDQDCMEQKCSAEIQTCMGPADGGGPEAPSAPPTDGGEPSSQ